MTKFMEISSIGVSKESQLRAARILGVITEDCQNFGISIQENFFEYAQSLMAERWEKLQDVIENSKIFTLPKYPEEFCNFAGKYTKSYPGNAINIQRILFQKTFVVSFKKTFSLIFLFVPDSFCMAEVQ